MTSPVAPTSTTTATNNNIRSNIRSPQQQQRRMAPIGDSSLSMQEEWEQQQHIEQPKNKVSPVEHDKEEENDQSLFRGSRYDYRRDDSAVRDVVCASTALMGENILDSPVSNNRPQYRQGESSTSRMFQLRDCSSLGTPRSGTTNASMTGSDFLAPPSLYTSEENGNHTTSSTTNTNTSSSSRSSRAMSVGIMAQGLAWARRQRDRRKQQYLQLQAEQQLRKIKMAHEEQHQQQQTTTSIMIDESRLDNGSLQNLGHSRSSSSGEQGVVGEFVVVDHYPSTAFEISKKISKSGDGYSVELPGVLVSHDDNDPQQHHHHDQDPDDASWVPPVRIEEEPPETMASCPFILNAHERQQIAVHVLPAGISSYCKWKRYYSLARDGDSFDNCLRNLQHIKPTLLVVRTARNAVFGGLADEAWEPHSAAGACFYGGSAACLFKIVPSHVATNDNERNSTETTTATTNTTRVQYFRWSGANRYVQLCDVSNKMLAFGGGGEDGSFGLCVEQDFQVGSTGPCATFDNEPLCDQENFDICDMEIYGFLQGQF